MPADLSRQILDTPKHWGLVGHNLKTLKHHRVNRWISGAVTRRTGKPEQRRDEENLIQIFHHNNWGTGKQKSLIHHSKHCVVTVKHQLRRLSIRIYINVTPYRNKKPYTVGLIIRITRLSKHDTNEDKTKKPATNHGVRWDQGWN